jgi:hypothetical protein
MTTSCYRRCKAASSEGKKVAAGLKLRHEFLVEPDRRFTADLHFLYKPFIQSSPCPASIILWRLNGA